MLAENLRRSIARLTGKSVITGGFALNDETYLRNGYYGIYNALGGNRYSTALGSTVTDDRALMLSTFFACVKIISEDVGTLPLFTYQETADGKRLAKENPLYSLLHDSPNPDMTASSYRETVTAHALMCEHSYSRIERSRSDPSRIIALWPLMPLSIRKDKDSRGRPVYISSDPGSKTYQQSDIFELHGFGLTGTDGLSIMQYARETIGLGVALQEYAVRFFAQDQTPNLVLTHPGKLGADGLKGVKKAWADHGQGPDSWHTPRVLQEGMKAEQMHPDAEKSQLTAQRSFQLLEVCRFFRMPPHKLAELGRSTWGNLEEQNIQYVTETLRPWLVRWEQSMKMWLFGTQSDFYAEHSVEGLQRGSFMTQTTGFAQMLDKGVYSINEVRKLWNLNPIDGGEDHFIQLNMATVQQVAGGASIPDQTPPPQNSDNASKGPQLVRVGGRNAGY